MLALVDTPRTVRNAAPRTGVLGVVSAYPTVCQEQISLQTPGVACPMTAIVFIDVGLRGGPAGVPWGIASTACRVRQGDNI